MRLEDVRKSLKGIIQHHQPDKGGPQIKNKRMKSTVGTVREDSDNNSALAIKPCDCPMEC